MKEYWLVISVLMLGACSSPRYAYNFDYQDYNSGKKRFESNALMLVSEPIVIDTYLPATSDQNALIASLKPETYYVTEDKPKTIVGREEAVAQLKSISRDERRDLKTKIKAYIKDYKKSDFVSTQAKAGMAQDVKLAAIFGSVGIVLLIIGGDVLAIIGTVALLIGLYFFIRWLIHQ